MIIKDGEYADIATGTGPMRTHIFRPVAPGKYPGVVLYSEIFQITGPIRRTAAMLGGGDLAAEPAEPAESLHGSANYADSLLSGSGNTQDEQRGGNR